MRSVQLAIPVAVVMAMAACGGRASAAEPQAGASGARPMCEMTADYGYPVGPRYYRVMDQQTGKCRLVREPGWVGGVFLPSLKLWYRGVCDYVSDKFEGEPRGVSYPRAVCTMTCPPRNDYRGTTTVAMKPKARLPFPVVEGAKPAVTEKRSAISTAEVTSVASEAVKIVPAEDVDAEPLRLVVDMSAGSGEEEEVKTWRPVGSQEPPLLPEGIGNEAATITQETSGSHEQANNEPTLTVRVEEPAHAEPAAQSPKERPAKEVVVAEESPVTWGEQFRQWRVWLAVAGMALILIGWVGRAAPVK
jgi:hypothetical protein